MARSVLSCLLLGLLASASALSLGARAAPAAAARGCPTMMAAAAFRTGDMVKILSGDDKGAVRKERPAPRKPAAPPLACEAGRQDLTGVPLHAQVISLDRKTNKVVVEGVNVRATQLRPHRLTLRTWPARRFVHHPLSPPTIAADQRHSTTNQPPPRVSLTLIATATAGAHQARQADEGGRAGPAAQARGRRAHFQRRAVR